MQKLVKQFKPGKKTIFIKNYYNYTYSYFLEFPEVRIYKDGYFYYCYFYKDNKFYKPALFNCVANNLICLGEDKNLNIFDSYFSFDVSGCLYLYCLNNNIKIKNNKDYLQFLSRWEKKGMFFNLIEIKKEDYAKISQEV